MITRINLLHEKEKRNYSYDPNVGAITMDDFLMKGSQVKFSFNIGGRMSLIFVMKKLKTSII